jgi:hypothetical protein
MRKYRARLVVFLLVLVAAVTYLRDPAWIGGITSGLTDWRRDADGTMFRWTTGRASFYVPSDATMMTLPLRVPFPIPNGGTSAVQIWIDDRWLADVELTDTRWRRPVLPLPRRSSTRRYRRVDLHVSRTFTVGPARLGVETGEIELDRSGPAR